MLVRARMSGLQRLLTAHRRSDVWIRGLAVLAICNLLAGVYISFFDRARSSDLRSIYAWCHDWLYRGADLYAAALPPDYPPNAIVTYGLLAAIPKPWLVAAWAMTTLALTPFLPLVVMRSVSRSVRVSAAIVPTLLFCCWGGVRTLLQFSQLSFLLAFVAVALPQQWVIGGLCLGLALAKPHIAGPIAIWAVAARKIGVVCVAAAVCVVEYGVYCWRAGVTLSVPLVEWAQGLSIRTVGLTVPDGYTSAHPWVVAAIGDPSAAEAVWVSVCAIVLMALCVAAVRDRTKTLAIPALLCLWSLIAMYHHLNNLAVMILPAFIFLLTLGEPTTHRQRLWAAGIIQAALMLDIPVRLRGLAEGVLGKVIADVDRALVLGTFMMVAWCWWRLQRAAAADHAN